MNSDRMHDQPVSPVHPLQADRGWRPRLRLLTFVVTMVAFASLILMQLGLGRYLYESGFVEAEQRDLLARARHSQAVLQQGFSQLSSAASDYAPWNDTYRFVHGQQPTYQADNFTAATLQRYGADIVMITDVRGVVLLQVALDAGQDATTGVPPAELRLVQTGGAVWAGRGMDDVTEGYAAIGEVPYQWATAPIRPTDLTGDPAGWFTMMRRLDAPFMETLQRTLDSSTAFEIVPDAAHKTDASVPLRFEELQLAPPRGNFVDASFTVAPLAGNQHLTLRISTPRHFIQRMSEISSWFALGSLVLGVLIAMLAIRWLQQRLLSPLARLSDGLLAIGSDVNGDAAARLPAIGHGDEISGVGLAVNRMLDRIESSRDAENARDRAEAASRSKSEFLARISHEIRTPMNGVLGMTELLRSTRLDTRQQQYTRAIAESAEALLLIINDILDVSKIEAGRMRLDEASFDLEQLMEQSAELLAGRAHQKGLDLICRIPPALHMAYRGDAMRLRQILVNLLGNAVKFTPRGQVLLQVETLEGGASGKSILHFEVSDTGIGIRPENQELIFESFSQEDGSTTRRFGGTGLGLSISKQLVGLMHGQIGVRSVVGEGSSFWFTVELEREADGGRSAASEPLAGLRILVVDDNPLNRQILDEQLRGWQVDVVTAEDAAEGLRLLQEFQDAGRSFDLAILDYHMPLMNGMDLVRVMRGRPAFRDLPVVMLSSMSGLAEPDNKSLGVCAWLTKPVRRANLHTALVGVLRPDESFPAATTDNTALPLLGLRVLLVEDNPVNQAVAIGMLEQIACKVRTSADGLDALQCFRQESFDLILMDCQMPELDGYEATRRLRQIEASDGRTPTPVVALTANALEGDRERCLEAGMDEYLSKPFTAQQLLAVIRLVLPALPAMPEAAPASAAPAAEAVSGEVLEPQALQRIRAMQQQGGPDILGTVIGIYLDNSVVLVDKVRAGIAAGDAKLICDAAHALKSSSANLGANTLSAIARQLEAMRRESDLSAALPLAERLFAEHARVVEALHNEMQRKATA